MSYMVYEVQCDNCGKKETTAFGIVGEFVRKAMEYDKLKAELQTERTAREKAEATLKEKDNRIEELERIVSDNSFLEVKLKEKDAEIGRLEMELAESKDSHTAKQRLRLCDKINKLESQLQAQAEVNKAVSGLLRKIEVCSYIDEILEEVDVVHNALTRLEAEGKAEGRASL